MVPQVKKDAAAPPEAEAKAKALKAKKAELKGVRNHTKKKIRTSPTFRGPRYCGDKGGLTILGRAPGRNKPDHSAISKFPLTTESAMKKTEDNSTRVFIVDGKANKHRIKQAGKTLCDTDTAVVNALTRPDGQKTLYTLSWLPTMMLPTKLGSSNLSPAG
ncbi:60S ribosomal protein L23a-like [Rhinolophus ferrumequinum]|uniref:60S ribosomal protein L23a-like n=1 Tax=Rhinolophus ferrumequinum TaxID=59479 RepID=UPI00140FEDA0|nr:60S ribosomal protein L23a-like [Rhinolophus ferrumequinum]